MWWLHRAGYHKMLCFWGLTEAERQAYIPAVGRVAGMARKAPMRPRSDGRSGVARPWLEAHRQSTRSYRHRRLNRQHEAPNVAQIATAGELDRESGGWVGGKREVGRPAMRELEPTAPSSSNECFVAPGRPRRYRSRQAAEVTQPKPRRPRTTPRKTPPANATRPPLQHLGRTRRDERTNWQSPERYRK